MTIYVDDARIPARVGRLQARWSHLTADTKGELHVFAARLGLRRAWFQDDGRRGSAPGSWHYDLTESKRTLAIRLGATEVPARDFAQVWKQPGREGREHLPAPTPVPPERTRP